MESRRVGGRPVLVRMPSVLQSSGLGPDGVVKPSGYVRTRSRRCRSSARVVVASRSDHVPCSDSRLKSNDAMTLLRHFAKFLERALSEQVGIN